MWAMRVFVLLSLCGVVAGCATPQQAPPLRPGAPQCVVTLESSMSKGIAVVQDDWVYVGYAGQVDFVGRDYDGEFATNEGRPRPIGRMFNDHALLLPKGRQKQDIVEVSQRRARVYAFHDARTYASSEGCSARQFAFGIAGIEHYLIAELVSNEDEE
jgi:hypothetical protein